MIEHPGDTPSQRFSAFWLGLGSILLFGVLAAVVWLFSDTDDVISASDQEIIDGRLAIKKEVMAAQAKLMDGFTAATETATVAELKTRNQATKSSKPAPGTPAFDEMNRKLMEAQKAEEAKKKAEEAKKKAEEEAKKKGGEK